MLHNWLKALHKVHEASFFFSFGTGLDGLWTKKNEG
jgi:hypothetical protein